MTSVALGAAALIVRRRFLRRARCAGGTAFKNHCSLFGVSGALMKTHRKALAPYKMSKGTIQFTVEKPLPMALVRTLVKARVKENEARR